MVALGSSGVGCADEVFPGIQARLSAPYGADWIRNQVCVLSIDPPFYFNCTTTSEANEEQPQLGMIAANIMSDSVFDMKSNAVTLAAMVLLTGVLSALAISRSIRHGLRPIVGTQQERTELCNVSKQKAYNACEMD